MRANHRKYAYRLPVSFLPVLACAVPGGDKSFIAMACALTGATYARKLARDVSITP